MTQFALNAADKQSSVWVKLLPHFAQRIETLRNQLEGDLETVRTAEIRGRIKELRALMALNKEPAAAE